MAKRCGCVGDECSCAIFPGLDIEISGKGNTTSPHVVKSFARARIEGRERPGGRGAVSGTGSITDPYVLSVDLDPLVVAPKRIDVFDTVGTFTWTRWAGCSLVKVTVIGGGQAGQQGSDYGNTFPVWGGQGGAGGGLTSRVVYIPSDVTTATVVVGAGGISPGMWTYNSSPLGSQVAPIGQVGGVSAVVFKTANALTRDEVLGYGGGGGLGGGRGGVGEQYGQFAYPITSITGPGAWPVESGAAGGNGASVLSNENGLRTTQALTAGGTHPGYNGTVKSNGRGGNGGTGGGLGNVNSTFNVMGPGLPGADGYKYGAGGGGGGAGTSQKQTPPNVGGGKGGNGASGFVMIEEL